MNYTPKIYAKAFCESAVLAKTGADIDKAVKNLLIQVKLNRDQKKLKYILSAAQKIIMQKKGGRKLTLETARLLTLHNEKIVNSLAKAGDIVEKRTNKSIIAGIKININDEFLLDQSFATKIKKILK